MKTLYTSTMVLVLGLAAFTSARGQKTSKEYDDMYYIPSDKKSVQTTEKQEEVAPSVKKDQPTNYEKYINSLEKQRVQKDVQPQYSEDSLDYAQDKNYVGGEYEEKDGTSYVTNNYYNSDDYGYGSRIRRFYDPFYSAGYFDPWYYDPFYYSPGMSFGMSFGYPYMGFGMSYGWPGYSPFGYYDYYGYGFGGYSPYWYGYNRGFYSGYYGGYYGDNLYYPNHKPVYYGPRRSIETNRLAARNATYTGRRTGSDGRRSIASGNSSPRTYSNMTKSTRDGSTGYTGRRPYGSSAGTSSGRLYNSTSARQRTYSTATGNRTSINPNTRSSYSSQDRPVYTRPSTTTSQSRSTYSGASKSSGNSYYRTSRPTGSSGSTYSRPGGSSGSSYSRPSGSSGSSYSRSSGSSGSYRSSGSSGSYSRSSGSSGSSYSSGGGRSSSSGSSGGGSRSGSSRR